MSLGNLILFDGEDTPVAHTFVHARTGTDFAQWDEPAVTNYIGRPKVTMEMIRPKGQSRVANRNVKCKIRVEVPTMETLSNDTATGIAPAPTIAYRLMAEVVYTLPDRSSEQERENLSALLAQCLSTADAKDFVNEYKTPG